MKKFIILIAVVMVLFTAIGCEDVSTITVLSEMNTSEMIYEVVK